MSDEVPVIRQHTCLCCGHRWFPRTPDRPRICPQCKTARWDIGPRSPKREHHAA
jgi:hypothetical protein